MDEWLRVNWLQIAIPVLVFFGVLFISLWLRRIAYNALERWLKGPPEKGDTFEEYTLELDQSEGVDSKDVYTFLQRRQVRWGGVAMMANDVECTLLGMNTKMTILDDGNFLRGQMGPVEIRMEEEAVAKDFKAAVFDMLFQVSVDRDLGDPEKVDALTIQCVADFSFPV